MTFASHCRLFPRHHRQTYTLSKLFKLHFNRRFHVARPLQSCKCVVSWEFNAIKAGISNIQRHTTVSRLSLMFFVCFSRFRRFWCTREIEFFVCTFDFDMLNCCRQVDVFIRDVTDAVITHKAFDFINEAKLNRFVCKSIYFNAGSEFFDFSNRF